MNKKLKPLTIFLSDDELVNFKSHFDKFLNMNCDDKIKEQQQENDELREDIGNYVKIVLHDRKEIERLNTELELYKDNHKHLNNLLEQKDNIIKEVREYIENTHYYSEVINEEYLLKEELLEILDKENI